MLPADDDAAGDVAVGVAFAGSFDGFESLAHPTTAEVPSAASVVASLRSERFGFMTGTFHAGRSCASRKTRARGGPMVYALRMKEEAVETRDEREELIERIVAKAELEFKCSGSHFSCAGEAGIESD